MRILGGTPGTPQRTPEVEQRHLDVGVHEVDRAARVASKTAREHVVRGHVAVDHTTVPLLVTNRGEIVDEFGKPVEGERARSLFGRVDRIDSVVERREERAELCDVRRGRPADDLTRYEREGAPRDAVDDDDAASVEIRHRPRRGERRRREAGQEAMDPFQLAGADAIVAAYDYTVDDREIVS